MYVLKEGFTQQVRHALIIPKNLKECRHAFSMILKKGCLGILLVLPSEDKGVDFYSILIYKQTAIEVNS